METGDKIIDAVVSSRSASIQRVPVPSPRVGLHVAPPKKRVYFEFHIDAPSKIRKSRKFYLFSPGNEYKVTIIASVQHANLQRDLPSFAFRGNSIVVTLECPRFPELEINSPLPVKRGDMSIPNSIELTATDWYKEDEEIELTFDFTVTAPSDCPDQIVFLELYCARGDANGLSERVCRVPVKLMGEGKPISKKRLTRMNIDCSIAPPGNVAFLYVYESDRESIRMKGWNSRRHLIHCPRIPKPDISLARITSRKMFIPIVARIKEFSKERLSELTKWLGLLSDFHKEDLCLVIIDDTDAEIPWEMISLKAGYIGSEVEVVRWTDISKYGDDLRLSPQTTVVNGCTLSFLHGNSEDLMHEEKNALNNLNASCLNSAEEVLDRFRGGLSGVGLLYIACHGEFVRGSRKKIKIELSGTESVGTGADEPQIPISVEHLHVLDRKEGGLPIVFVNACHSGRLLHDKTGGRYYGFPRIFLSKVAHAYVGTLGEVGVPFAAKIGAFVLRQLSNSASGVRLSKILKELRLQAAREFGEASLHDINNYEKFVDTFMYVYYGNPLTHLMLQSKPTEGVET